MTSTPTPGQLLGFRKDGRPIRLLAGADHAGSSQTGSGQGGDGNGGSAGDGSGGNGPTGQGEATFTQSDVDRIVADRLGRERSKYSDYTDLKAKAKRLDDIETQNATDLDKATKRADDAEARAKAATERSVRAEVRALAAGEWNDPTDAALYLGDLGRFVRDDGEIDTQTITTELADVLKAKPHLAKPNGGQGEGPGQGGQGGQGGGQAGDQPRPKPDPSQGARADEPPPMDQRVASRLERIKADTGLS